MRPERILIVDDEPGWVALVSFWLSQAGYANVESAANGNGGLEAAERTPPDCIILDLVLPDQGGLEVCQKLRSLPALSRTPVILLTAHKKEKVLGLQCGADYFLGKSERPEELLATLNAALRRKLTQEGILSRGDLTLKSQERSVLWKGSPVVHLSPKMFVLLHVLMQRSPQPVSRAELYRLVEGVDNPGLSRALDVMLNRLRKALPAEVRKMIVNVKNFGYVFLDSSSAEPASPPA